MALPRAARKGWFLGVVGALILMQDVLFGVVAVLLISLFVSGVRNRLDSMATLAASFAVMASVVSPLPTNLGAETLDAVMTQTHIVLRHEALCCISY